MKKSRGILSLIVAAALIVLLGFYDNCWISEKAIQVL